MRSDWRALGVVGIALLAACTEPNPNAHLDGLGVGDAPASETSRWDLGDGPRPADGAGDGSAACTPVGHKSVLTKSDSLGDWSVVLEPQCTYASVTISGATAKQAAAAFDYDSAGTQVAGFVVSRAATTGNVTTEAATAAQDLRNAIGGDVAPLHAGSAGTAPGGHAMLSGIVLEFHVASTTISQVRDTAVAALLGVAKTSLGGLPAAWGTSGSSFVVRLATVRRTDGRTLFMGAVTDKPSDDDISKLSSAIAQDAASGSGLAAASATSNPSCESQTVTQAPKSQVDIIWVMDETVTMDAQRANIAGSATSIYSQLGKAGLDFRMGVTNVCDPSGSYSSAVGKFCSTASTTNTDDGGPDQFLGQNDATTFAACVKNPPGYEQGNEYGLTNAKAAVSRHLPRAKNDATKIRTDAQVVIIVVSDEAPQEVETVLGTTATSKCALNPSQTTQLKGIVNPYLDYFSGTSDSQTKVDHFQAIAGVCGGASCSPYTSEIAHGYREVAQKFNGQVFDVCQTNLAPTLTAILSSVVAHTAPVTLKTTPIAASLKVALDGVVVQRSMVNGFIHPAGTNKVLFTGSSRVKKGSSVVASYRTWK